MDVLGSLQDAQFFLKARCARLGPWHACVPGGGARQRVLARQRCTANRTKLGDRALRAVFICYRRGSSAIISSALRLKRRGQQERSAREGRREERNNDSRRAARCRGAVHRYLAVKPRSFWRKKPKIFFAGLRPAPRWGSAPDPILIDHPRRRLHVVPRRLTWVGFL